MHVPEESDAQSPASQNSWGAAVGDCVGGTVPGALVGAWVSHQSNPGGHTPPDRVPKQN